MMRPLYLTLLLFLVVISALAQSPEDLESGKRLFEGQCARCHGIGGNGGMGPSLNRPTLRHAADDEALFSVIKNGIPGTGMPETWQMTDREIRQVAGYVRSLGRTPARPLPGDRERGKRIYETKGGCAACHVIQGQGRSLGPDLGEVGARRGLEYLREALVDPSATLPFNVSGHSEFLVVRILTDDGREVRGIRVNEDSFTIQLRDEQDRFYSFRKLDLKVLEKRFGESLMPSYQRRLSASEITDLVAYLASLRGGL